MYFGKCDPLVKLKLLKLYCSDVYGSILCDMSHSCVEDVCRPIAWCNGLRRALWKQYCKVCFSSWYAFEKNKFSYRSECSTV